MILNAILKYTYFHFLELRFLFLSGETLSKLFCNIKLNVNIFIKEKNK